MQHFNNLQQNLFNVSWQEGQVLKVLQHFKKQVHLELHRGYMNHRCSGEWMLKIYVYHLPMATALQGSARRLFQWVTPPPPPGKHPIFSILPVLVKTGNHLITARVLLCSTWGAELLGSFVILFCPKESKWWLPLYRSWLKRGLWTCSYNWRITISNKLPGKKKLYFILYKFL